MLVIIPLPQRCKMDPSSKAAIFSGPITNHLASFKDSGKTKMLLGHGLKSLMNTAIGLLDKLNSVKVNSKILQCVPVLNPQAY